MNQVDAQIYICIFSENKNSFFFLFFFTRDCLWKFFFPPDYQVMKVSEIAQPGKPRQILAFELRMNIIADATIDLLFTKNRVNNETLSRN